MSVDALIVLDMRCLLWQVLSLPPQTPIRGGRTVQVGVPRQRKRRVRRHPVQSRHRRDVAHKKTAQNRVQAVCAFGKRDANPGTVFFRCRISMPCLCSPCQMRIADGVYVANRTAASETLRHSIDGKPEPEALEICEKAFRHGRRSPTTDFRSCLNIFTDKLLIFIYFRLFALK